MTDDDRARQFVKDWLREDADVLSCSRAMFTDAVSALICGAKREALERAARVADKAIGSSRRETTASIRALKSLTNRVAPATEE